MFYLESNNINHFMSGLICTHNSLGLLNDAKILQNVSYTANVHLDILQYEFSKIESIEIHKNYKYIIFLEHICPKILQNKAIYIYIPNVELINSTDNQIIKNKLIDYIFAKTEFSNNNLHLVYSNYTKIVKTLWTSIDRFVPDILKDFSSFLHVKGCSKFKNSQLLLDLWSKHPEWPQLTIVHHGNPNFNGFLELKEPIKYKSNITIYQYKLDDKHLKYLMNICGVHICPSEMEGYGHYINEGLSTGAIVIGSDGPPMNEINKHGIQININSSKKINLGFLCSILEKDIENSINYYLKLSSEDRIFKSNLSIKLYIENHNTFVNKIISFYNSSSV